MFSRRIRDNPYTNENVRCMSVNRFKNEMGAINKSPSLKTIQASTNYLLNSNLNYKKTDVLLPRRHNVKLEKFQRQSIPLNGNQTRNYSSKEMITMTSRGRHLSPLSA
jgi:hypothetical protein